MRKVWKKKYMHLCVLFLIACIPESVFAAGSLSATATAVSSTKIELNWGIVDEAGSYAIYRKGPADSGFKRIKEVVSVAYRDTGISPGVTYAYKIVAISRENGKEMFQTESTVTVKTPKKAAIKKVAVKKPTAMQIIWETSTGSTGYQIFRSVNEHGGYEEIGRVSGKASCSFTDENVVPGKAYYYKIRPTNQNHMGTGSFSAPVRGRTIAKTAITSIASLSSEKMQISWRKVSNAQAYEIYRSVQSKGKFKKIATVKGSIRKYVDKSVKSGKKYYYKISAIGNLNGARISSGYSKTASFRALKQVKIASVKLTAQEHLLLKWGKVAGATKYRIFRASSKNGSYKKIAIVPGKASSIQTYTDKNVVSGKTYYYRVQAYSEEKGVISAGSGSKSEVKSASMLYQIMGETSVTADQMAALYYASGKSYPSGIYKDKGAKNIEKFCEIVLEESEGEGVKAEVIFAQICLETGYLQFYGQVSATQCNFSGLGATDDGAAGATFPDVRTGIRAQVQHLKGYASKEPLNQECVDPRFVYLASRRGTAKYVEDLGGGNWATDPDYASKLKRLINAMKSY